VQECITKKRAEVSKLKGVESLVQLWTGFNDDNVLLTLYSLLCFVVEFCFGSNIS